MNTTLKKISEMLNISISTVSRALKNHPDISVLTKTKVKELAEMLDYEPNSNAINLRAKNSKVFGLLVSSVSNSFYDSFMSAIEEESTNHGFSLMIMQSHDNPENEINILKIYKQTRVSGVFACLSPNTIDIKPFDKLNDLSIPLVFFDKVPDETNKCTRVSFDNMMVAKEAALAIINAGKKNVLAIFGNPNLSITKERVIGLKKAFIDEKQIQLTIEFVDSSDAAKQIATAYFVKDRCPDAVFCMSDEILIGVMKVVQELKISYPDTLGIISISDGVFPKLYYPEITYIETSGYNLGKLAFEAMLKCIDHTSHFEASFLEPILINLGSL